MIDSKTLKANLRRDKNALELAALYVRALYLLNMSDRDVDSDSRHNFGATKKLLISVMGINVIDDCHYGFFDRDLFSSRCTAENIDDFYADIIDEEETLEYNEKDSTMSGNAMLMLDKVSMLSTIENAEAYVQTNEKFTFCIDLLEISAHNFNSDYWVNALENNLDAIINAVHLAAIRKYDEETKW